VIRTDQTRVAKKRFQSKEGGRRFISLEDVQNDLREPKMWPKDKYRRMGVVKEAKVLRQP
jgi:hypothetical protein